MSTSELTPVAKPVGGRVVRRAQHADEAAAVVAEEEASGVLGRERGGDGTIKRRAGDRAERAGVLVGVDRVSHARHPGRIRAFGLRPAEVRARDRVVDLFPGVLADVVDVDAAVRAVDREVERVAQSACPDRLVDAGGLAEERIVGRNRAIGVDAQHLAERRRQRLRVAAVRVVADGDVELAVVAEMDGAAVVIRGRAQRREIQQLHFAARGGDVGIRRARGEAAHAVVDRCGRGRVVHVHEVVGREVRIERDAEQTALARSIHAHGEERLRQQRAVADDAQRAALLRDEHAAIGRDRHGRSGSRGPWPRASRRIRRAESRRTPPRSDTRRGGLPQA